jgi:hypothetical protein
MGTRVFFVSAHGYSCLVSDENRVNYGDVTEKIKTLSEGVDKGYNLNDNLTIVTMQPFSKYSYFSIGTSIFKGCIATGGRDEFIRLIKNIKQDAGSTKLTDFVMKHEVPEKVVDPKYLKVDAIPYQKHKVFNYVNTPIDQELTFQDDNHNATGVFELTKSPNIIKNGPTYYGMLLHFYIIISSEDFPIATPEFRFGMDETKFKSVLKLFDEYDGLEEKYTAKVLHEITKYNKFIYEKYLYNDISTPIKMSNIIACIYALGDIKPKDKVIIITNQCRKGTKVTIPDGDNTYELVGDREHEHRRTLSSGVAFNETIPLLHRAVHQNNYKLVEEMIKSGSVNPEELNVKLEAEGATQQDSLLVYSIWYQRRDMARVLIEGGADVNMDNPLYYAVQKNLEDICELLLEKGAKIDEHIPLQVRYSSRNMKDVFRKHEKLQSAGSRNIKKKKSTKTPKRTLFKKKTTKRTFKKKKKSTRRKKKTKMSFRRKGNNKKRN